MICACGSWKLRKATLYSWMPKALTQPAKAFSLGLSGAQGRHEGSGLLPLTAKLHCSLPAVHSLLGSFPSLCLNPGSSEREIGLDTQMFPRLQRESRDLIVDLQESKGDLKPSIGHLCPQISPVISGPLLSQDGPEGNKWLSHSLVECFQNSQEGFYKNWR